MPLRCIDDRGTDIEAHLVSREAWEALKALTRTRRHLAMPCCRAQAVPKTSKLGTQFFAHKARAHCQWKPETEEHRHLKALALQAARRSGWNARTEVGGETPNGERWTADVFAQKGEEKIAIEIQWSGQTNEETRRRQDKYRQSGVTGLWLLRQPGFPISRDLPAACIGGSMEDGLKIMLPKEEHMSVRNRTKQEGWFQIRDPDDFLDALFEGRFHFGIPPHTVANLDIIAHSEECRRCRGKIQMVTRLKGNVGPHELAFYGDSRPQSLAREYPAIKAKIMEAIGHRTDVGKTHVSHGYIFTYVKCRCPKCGTWTRGTREFELLGWNETTIGTIELEADILARELPSWVGHCWAVWEYRIDAPLEAR